MADKPKSSADNFISKIVKDPKQVPETILLNGYLGASSEDKHTRLYFDVQLSSYVEIPDDGILHTQDYPADTSPFGGSYVWIKKDAILIHGKVGTERRKAQFLEGAIVNDYMRAAAFPQEGGIDNTVAFCPQTFADLPCGLTTQPIACTILEPYTKQAYCPTQGCPTQVRHWCPPPPTPNCPTHNHSPFVCATRICELEIKDALQPVKPYGYTLGLCTTTQIPPLCPQQTHNPLQCAHITVGSPICNHTVLAQICPTQTPNCFFTIRNPVCRHTLNIPCITHNVICQHVTTNPVCHTGIACPSLGPCPSIACGFPGDINQGY